MNATASLPALLTRAQAAEFLGVTPGTLAVWHSTGRHSLPVVHVGAAVRYKISDLEKWIESRTRTATA